MDGTGRRFRRLLGDAVDRRADAVSAAVLVALMATVRVLWPVDRVIAGDWSIAALLMIAAFLTLARIPRSPGRWLVFIGLSILLGAMFWAANQGLDLIRPPGSRRHDAAATVAGFELWAVLCPGLTIVALAGLSRALVLRSHRG